MPERASLLWRTAWNYHREIITSKKFSYHSIRAEVVRFVSGHRFSDDAKAPPTKRL